MDETILLNCSFLIYFIGAPTNCVPFFCMALQLTTKIWWVTQPDLILIVIHLCCVYKRLSYCFALLCFVTMCMQCPYRAVNVFLSKYLLSASLEVQLAIIKCVIICRNISICRCVCAHLTYWRLIWRFIRKKAKNWNKTCAMCISFTFWTLFKFIFHFFIKWTKNLFFAVIVLVFVYPSEFRHE